MSYSRVGVLFPTPSGAKGCLVVAFLLLSHLTACTPIPLPGNQVNDLPPLQLQGQDYPVDAVADLAPTPDLLDLDDEMREFVSRYAGPQFGRRQKLMNLHRAVTGAGALNLEYDPFAEGTARETFHRGSANCLSYANLFVALAREAGLVAQYQWLEVRPQWTRMGERVALRLHVNVAIRLKSGETFMVDIDPLPRRDIAGSQVLSDTDAQALYHNNIAMDALAREDVEQAWLHAVRALQLSPQMAHLWVNIGAVYRLAGQHRAAEESYLYALELDPWDRSAMNNLVVLYTIEERDEDRAYWERKVDAYRDTNPYYHAWLGDQAGEEGDWRGALEHYREAVALSPEDSGLLYATGIIYFRLDRYKAAARYIELAINNATLRSEINHYREQLEEIDRARVAQAM